MVRFIKENSRLITKMIVNQLGMTIFGLVLSAATSQHETLFVFTSVFSIGFYMVLLYTMCWETGAKDKIRLDAGRIAYTPLKTLWCSLVANSLNLLLAILSLIGYAFCTVVVGSDGLSLTGPIWAQNMFGVCNNLARLIQGMYVGVIQHFMPNNPIVFLLIVLPALFTCWLGYFIAIKGHSISQIFGIKNRYNGRN